MSEEEKPPDVAPAMPRWVPIAIGVVLVLIAALAVWTGIRYRHPTLANGIVKSRLYRLEQGSRIADAVSRAGGVTPKAELAQVNLAAPLAVDALSPDDEALVEGRSESLQQPAVRGVPDDLVAEAVDLFRVFGLHFCTERFDRLRVLFADEHSWRFLRAALVAKWTVLTICCLGAVLMLSASGTPAGALKG